MRFESLKYLIPLHANIKNTSRREFFSSLTFPNIPTPGGIRQSDTLNPLLFNLSMNKIIKKITSLNLGYRMGNKRIDVVCYADDAAIIAESENDLRRQLFQFFQADYQL